MGIQAQGILHYRKTEDYRIDWLGYFISPLITTYDTTIGNVERFYRNFFLK